MEDNQVLNIIGQELSQAAGGDAGDAIEANREAALGAYLGQPNGKEVVGRSAVVSTDVADAIEWILPEIIKAFTQNNEVITFDASHEGGEEQAELESTYVYDILMKQNNGFLILHQFIKDALLQKNGFLKVFYDKDISHSVESYTGLTQQDLNVILANPTLELMELTELMVGGMALFDIKVKRSQDNSQIKIVAIPPEEFRVNKMHNSVDLSTARFTAHIMVKTRSELIESGYDRELVESLPSQDTDDDGDYRFYMQGETTEIDAGISGDRSLDSIEIAECYMHSDMNDDGIAELVKVTVAGGDNPTHILDIEEIDEMPFISSTAILMSHKLFGLSMYDRLKQIQEQKTALWRNILDNMNLQNNQRTVAVEGQVNLDDLLVSRPGGIIRVKSANAIAPYQTPALSPDAYKMMDYLDQVRAGRSGVTPEGPISDTMIGGQIGSEGVAQMMNQREELVGLMVRVFAETGIKPLCYMVRGLAIKHQDSVADYKFKGRWVQVNPSTWSDSSTATVRVGTGSGERKKMLTGLTQMAQIQEKILSNPSQALVTPSQVYALADDLAKATGLNGTSKYLLDPQSKEGQQNQQKVSQGQQQSQQKEMQQNQAMMQMQSSLAQAEMEKAKAASANVQLRAQAEAQKLQLDTAKEIHDREVDALKQRLSEIEAVSKEAAKEEELQFKYYDADQKAALKREELYLNDKHNVDVDNQGEMLGE